MCSKHRQSLIFQYHGYKCRECGQFFTESIPEKIPHARISCRAAEWIKSLLSKNMSVYAMKEEMNRLFELRDRDEAYYGWTKWFTAAKESGIPQLQKFAKLKEKRLKGLVAHATHPISTGKLEGMNNKIKVAKRIAYGYRDEDYFFRLIRYQSSLSIPKNP